MMNKKRTYLEMINQTMKQYTKTDANKSNDIEISLKVIKDATYKNQNFE